MALPDHHFRNHCAADSSDLVICSARIMFPAVDDWPRRLWKGTASITLLMSFLLYIWPAPLLVLFSTVL